MPAAVTGLRCIALINYKEFFPIKQTLIFEHLHKAIKSPIVVYHTVADLSFPLLSASLMLFLRKDHLPLGKIADHHSSFSQSVRDEMGCFVQTVTLFVALALGNALVHLG